jgi:hypothetical protein
MLTFTKQDSIVIAVTLGIVLSVPFLVSAFYTSSNIEIPNEATLPLANGNLAGHFAKPKDPGGDDFDSPGRAPEVDCDIYYGSPITFLESKEGSTERNAVFLLSQRKRYILRG